MSLYTQADTKSRQTNEHAQNAPAINPGLHTHDWSMTSQTCHLATHDHCHDYSVMLTRQVVCHV
jgi:hypothetical protein